MMAENNPNRTPQDSNNNWIWWVIGVIVAVVLLFMFIGAMTDNDTNGTPGFNEQTVPQDDNDGLLPGNENNNNQ